MKNKILIVEDDSMILSGLVYAFENEGYAVTACKSVSESKSAVSSNTFDLAILDMQLPDGSGFYVHEQLKITATAVIFLTVIDDEGNIVRAFESGADDYITKPFRLRELLARVKRTLNSQSGNSEIFNLGRVKIDTAAGKAYISDNLLDLTALEYRLLLTFATNIGQILSRSQILENIWDSAGNFVEDNTLKVNIKRLRENLIGNVIMQLVLDSGEAFSGLSRSYGMFTGMRHYVVLIGSNSDVLGFKKLGYYVEIIILQATVLGLGTDWVGGTFSKKHYKIGLAENEKIVCVITVGNVAETLSGREKFIRNMTHRKTKTIAQITGCVSTPPDWFNAGMNRQPVIFAYKNGIVIAYIAGIQPLGIVLDFGIAKLHFELGCGAGTWEFGNSGTFEWGEQK